MKFLSKFFKKEKAATATEYALLIALIFTVIIGSVSIFGTKVNSKYQSFNTSLS